MAVAKLLLAGIELTEGVDPGLDATHAVETQDLEMLRYEGDTVQREVDRSTLGGKASINTSPHTNTSFSVPLAGSGTPGAAPAWGILLRACGFNEVIDVGVDVAYQLPDNAADLTTGDTVTLYDYRSQVNSAQKTSGVRGACEITMGQGELPKISFTDMIGSYLTPVPEIEPSGIDWSKWLAEVPFTKDNVPVLTLDGVTMCTSAFNVAFGQAVSRRNLPGCESSVMSDYEVTGGMTAIAPDITTQNFWAQAESHNGVTLVPFVLKMGTVAGNIITISANEVQLAGITEEESNEGDLAYSFSLSMIDAPVITVT